MYSVKVLTKREREELVLHSAWGYSGVCWTTVGCQRDFADMNFEAKACSHLTFVFSHFAPSLLLPVSCTIAPP